MSKRTLDAVCQCFNSVCRVGKYLAASFWVDTAPVEGICSVKENDRIEAFHGTLAINTTMMIKVVMHFALFFVEIS